MSNGPDRILYISNRVRPVLQLALPQHCALCAARAGGRLVCAQCDAQLPRSGPACPVCALPTADGSVCGRCTRGAPPFAATHAAFLYAFPVDRLLQALKYGGALAYAEFFAAALADRVGGTTDLVVPMPLAPARQRQRGFNQAQEIARRVAHMRGLPLAQALARVRDTPAQAGLRWRDRARNMRGAFVARPDVAGRSVAIVDDVMTTGASVAAAAMAARRAGAVRVEAWVAARTLPPS
jgi:ComF family protein